MPPPLYQQRFSAPGGVATGREATVDIIRGLCIISMVFAHVALGGIGHTITHAAVWYDGAMGFVLLSGLIVGIVQQKTVARVSLRAAQLKALRRARLVYLAHLSLCVLAFVVAAVFPARDEIYASVDDLGGVIPAAVATLLLQINPSKAAILSLYVILLLATPIASWLMRRGRVWVLVAVVIVVFVLGHLLPELLTSPRQPGEFGEINVAAWQALYFLAFIAGWHWATVRKALRSPVLWVIAAGVAAVVIGYAHLTQGRGRPSIVWWAFSSGQMGPGTIVLAFAVMVTLFPIMGWLHSKIPSVTGVIARIGRRSLDCYIILAIFVLLLPSVWAYDRSTLIADVMAVGMLAVMWVWCRVRDARVAAKSEVPA